MSPELMALAVHDLKNALGQLEAQLGQLATGSPDPLAQQSHAQCVALRQRLVGFLTLYREDHGLTAHRTDESPHDLLQGLLARHVTPASAQPVLTLQVLAADDPAALPPGAEPAWCWMLDRHLVQLAMEAALHNACRYARGTVQLSAHVRDDRLVLRMDDDGPGPRTGSQAADLDNPHGTGLGLALCDAVAQAHGRPGATGSAGLTQRPGGGGRFELVLG